MEIHQGHTDVIPREGVPKVEISAVYNLCMSLTNFASGLSGGVQIKKKSKIYLRIDYVWRVKVVRGGGVQIKKKSKKK